MDANLIGTVIFFIVFIAVLGRMLLKVFKFGGLKAALFGAPIERTVGEVAGAGKGMMNVTLKVHELKSADVDRKVGLEIVAKSVASYQMMPISLSSAETKKLIQILQSATN